VSAADLWIYEVVLAVASTVLGSLLFVREVSQAQAETSRARARQEGLRRSSLLSGEPSR
jgi:hypothetical protein